MDDNDKFWAEVNFLQEWPALGKEVIVFRNFIFVTPWYEMSEPLAVYFGCSNAQIHAWMAWGYARSIRDYCGATLLYAWAVHLTTSHFPARWKCKEERSRHSITE